MWISKLSPKRLRVTVIKKEAINSKKLKKEIIMHKKPFGSFKNYKKCYIE
jgi:hypothetical protein